MVTKQQAERAIELLREVYETWDFEVLQDEIEAFLEELDSE